MKLSLIPSLIIQTSILCLPAFSATITIKGSDLLGVLTFRDASDAQLTTGSILQVGYFNGIDTALNPSSYTEAQWNTFTPVTGIGSANATKLTAINSVGSYDLAANGHNELDTDTDSLPAANSRLGIRVFNSTTSTATADFNTFTVFDVNWTFTDPSDLLSFTEPELFLFSETDTGLAWQAGGADAFRTSITAVPEPSSLALLGLGALTLTFRRRK